MDIRRSLGIGIKADHSISDFPNADRRERPTFTIGQCVKVNTTCEDIGLHGLTGIVAQMPSKTSAYGMRVDVDGSILPLLPEEITALTEDECNSLNNHSHLWLGLANGGRA